MDGDTDALQLISDHSPERLNKTDFKNQTALFWAATNGQDYAVELLLQAKAEVDIANNYGRTPLYRAAGKGHSGIVKLLLEAKADSNQADVNQTTPLFAATGQQVKKLLLAHGAQLDAPAEEELMSEEDEKATPVSTSQGDADLNEIFKPGQGEKQMMQKRQESQIMFQAGARKVILLQAGKLSPGYLQGWKVESGKLSPTSRPAAAS